MCSKSDVLNFLYAPKVDIQSGLTYTSQSFSKCLGALKIYAACAHEGSMCQCVILLELAGEFPSNCRSEMSYSRQAWGNIEATEVAVPTCQTEWNVKEKEAEKLAGDLVRGASGENVLFSFQLDDKGALLVAHFSS